MLFYSFFGIDICKMPIYATVAEAHACLLDKHLGPRIHEVMNQDVISDIAVLTIQSAIVLSRLCKLTCNRPQLY